jgi:AcrR family transcriptional regulator
MGATTRDRIVEASAGLFLRQGYAGAGMKQIVDASDATAGSVYHFFPGGKEELAAEALRWSGQFYEDLVAGIFDAEPDLVAGVRTCFEGAAAVLVETGYADACPVATVALEVASSNEPLRAVSAEVFASWHRAMLVRLRAAGVTGRRATDLAHTLVAALEGGFLLSRVAKDPAPMRSIGRSMVALVEATVSRTS